MMAELVGRMLGRYEIVSLLGAGGMGSVYRARDTQLKRDVAIKVLADAAQGDPHRLERFNREIRTVARLHHPNILEIHDFGQADGVAYAVMELLKGRNLRQLIRRRLLPVDQALEIAVAVAEGLGAAHHQGVLHRDIKPENIFVTSDGTVKILDFGLARQVTQSDPNADTISLESDLTTPGTVVGTTAYMSPEQVRGKELDPRSDIFSLGCVLYEMISGVHPFYRDTRADTMSAILNEHPPAISETRADLPPAIELIIGQCLNKDPEHRFDSARDVAFALGALSQSQSGEQEEGGDTVPLPKSALRWLTVVAVLVAVAVGALWGAKRFLPPALPDDKRIALMRFEAIGDGTQDRYLAAGLTEVIATGLTLLDDSSDAISWVVPRRAAGDRDPNRLGETHRTFNLTVAVMGGVERSQDRVRISLKLLHPPTGRVLRSSEIDESLGNLHSFQQSPILRIAEMLEIPVDETFKDRLDRSSTNVTGAFESLVLGSGMFVLANEDADLRKSIEKLSGALDLDPLLTMARVELSMACLELFRRTNDTTWLDRGIAEATRASVNDPESMAAVLSLAALLRAKGETEQAVAMLEDALASNPSSAEAQLQLAWAQHSMGRTTDAERQYRKVIYHRPGYWPDHYWLARLFRSEGRYEAAVNELRLAVGYAPQCPSVYNNLGTAYLDWGRPDLALNAFRESLSVESEGNYQAYSNLGMILFAEARFSDAAEMFQQALAISDTEYLLWGNLGYSLRWGAEPERAEKVFRKAIELAEAEREQSPDDPQLLCRIAGYHAALGQHEIGLQKVDEAIAANPTNPQIVAEIAETLEDFGERDRALERVEHAFALGVPPTRFETPPSLRNLLADERYNELVSSIRPAT